MSTSLSLLFDAPGHFGQMLEPGPRGDYVQMVGAGQPADPNPHGALGATKGAIEEAILARVAELQESSSIGSNQ